MVRVIIERHCRPGKESDLEKALLEMRGRAIRQKGYISGETLRSMRDPSVWLVLSTWASASLWNAWERSPERQDTERRIERLLVEPQEVSVFSFMRRGGSESAHLVDLESSRLGG
jgi:heme-degrading monooxygenase HmoA